MKRGLYWDSLKVILIILVIYGHAIAPYAPDGSFNRAMYSFIYSFHIPLFIFVSGIFSHIHDRERYKKRIIQLFETFVVFQIIRTMIPVIQGNEFSLKSFLCTNWIMWYLLSLTYWRLMVYFIPERWILYRKSAITLSLIISILVGFVPIYSLFGVQSTLARLPFFVIGYYAVEIDIRGYINKIPRMFAIGMLLIFFCFFYFVLNTNLSFVSSCHPYWTGDLLHTMIRIGARCIYIPIAVMVSIMVMRLIPRNKTLAKWGIATLFIYNYHSFALREFLFPLIDGGILPQNEWLLLIYAIIVFFGMLFLSRFRIFNILLNPISFVWEKLRKTNKNAQSL